MYMYIDINHLLLQDCLLAAFVFIVADQNKNYQNYIFRNKLPYTGTDTHTDRAELRVNQQSTLRSRNDRSCLKTADSMIQQDKIARDGRPPKDLLQFGEKFKTMLFKFITNILTADEPF